jgi:uncharacterized membrane protein YphA (DoxX/SURF4 family)
MRPFLQFPDLFFLAPAYVPLFLRVAAALVYLYIAWHTYDKREAIARISLPIIGRAGWAVWFAIVAEVLIGCSLLFGYYAQVGALIAAIGALKFIFLKRVIDEYDPISRVAAFLLFAVCASLTLSGAGIFAIDQWGL